MDSQQQSQQIVTKYAIFYQYNGSQYQGSQLQKDSSVNTVEKHFLQALINSKLIGNTRIHNFQKKLDWGRAARTDKGVHALANGVNLKLTLSEEHFDQEKKLKKQQIINTINSNLPSDIKVFSIKEVIKKFDMRTYIKYREYEYIMPFFVYKNKQQQQQQQSEQQDENIMKRINELCQKFLGTHNYHNYTKKMKPKEPQCLRNIISIDTEIIQKNEKKYIKFKIVGQSFIYHQIRNIMGMIVMMIYKQYPDSFIETSFCHNVLHIWLAPSHGLFLNRLRFDSYNKMKDIPELLQFDNEEEQSINEFREYLIENIINEDKMEKIYKEWIQDMADDKDIAEDDCGSVHGDY